MMVCISCVCVCARIYMQWSGYCHFWRAKSAMERDRERESTSRCVRMLLGTCCGKLCGGSFPVARATGSLFLLPHIYIMYSFVAFATLCINWTWTSHTQSLCELMFSRQTVFDDGHKWNSKKPFVPSV